MTTRTEIGEGAYRGGFSLARTRGSYLSETAANALRRHGPVLDADIDHVNPETDSGLRKLVDSAYKFIDANSPNPLVARTGKIGMLYTLSAFATPEDLAYLSREIRKLSDGADRAKEGLTPEFLGYEARRTFDAKGRVIG